jgi:hypothetical protein
LTQLTVDQMQDLFSGARFAEKRGLFNPTFTIPEWVAAWQAKVQAITDGPPCPSS